MSSLSILDQLATGLSTVLSLPVVHENPIVGRPELTEVVTLIWENSPSEGFTIGLDGNVQDSWRIVIYAANEVRLLTLKDELPAVEDIRIPELNDLILGDLTRWEPTQDLIAEAYALTTSITTIRS